MGSMYTCNTFTRDAHNDGEKTLHNARAIEYNGGVKHSTQNEAIILRRLIRKAVIRFVLNERLDVIFCQPPGVIDTHFCEQIM